MLQKKIIIIKIKKKSIWYLAIVWSYFKEMTTFLKLKLLVTKRINVKTHHDTVKKVTNFLINQNVGHCFKTSI